MAACFKANSFKSNVDGIISMANNILVKVTYEYSQITFMCSVSNLTLSAT